MTSPAQLEAMRLWRKRNPEKQYRSKLANYRQTQGAPNTGSLWTEREDRSITSPERPCDRELSKLLGRSMKAIQNRRSVLKKSEEQDAARMGKS